MPYNQVNTRPITDRIKELIDSGSTTAEAVATVKTEFNNYTQVTWREIDMAYGV